MKASKTSYLILLALLLSCNSKKKIEVSSDEKEGLFNYYSSINSLMVDTALVEYAKSNSLSKDKAQNERHRFRLNSNFKEGDSPNSFSIYKKYENFFPPIINQHSSDRHPLSEHTCTSISCVYYLKTFQELKEKGIKGSIDLKERLIFDPIATHIAVKNYHDDYMQKGLSISDVLDFVSTYGVMSISESKNLMDDEYVNSFIEKRHSRVFERKGISLYFTVYEKSHDKELIDKQVHLIQKVISEGFPVVVSFEKFSSEYDSACQKSKKRLEWNRDSKWNTKNDNDFNHTVLLVGYKRERKKWYHIKKHKTFEFLNSNGKEWCSDGLGSISFEQFKKCVTNIYLPVDNEVSNDGTDIEIAKITSGVKGRVSFNKNVPFKIDLTEIEPKDYNSMSISERLAEDDIILIVQDLVKIEFNKIRDKYPILIEKIKKGVIDKSNVLKRMCVKMNKDQTIRLWGSLTNSKILDMKHLKIELSFVNEKYQEVIKSNIYLNQSNNHFDKTFKITNKIAFFQIDSILVQNLEVVENIKTDEFFYDHQQIDIGFQKKLDLLKIDSVAYIDFLESTFQQQ